MSNTIHIDGDRRCIFVRYTPPVGVGEIIDVMEDTFDDPELRDIPWRIHDLRIASPDFPSTELRAVAGRAELLRKLLSQRERTDRRVAAIVPGDLAYGLGRMLQVFMHDSEREDPQFRVFRSFEQAAEWVGLGADHPDAWAEDRAASA
jgi:hypothetical protein